MPVERVREPVASARLRAIARRLLDASTLCAISTTSAQGRAHINTAYFAWSRQFEIVWLSAREARHSRNLLRHPTVAIAVYDSSQRWGGSDRGLQLFGAAREVTSRTAPEAERLYGRRFKAYARERGEYSLYRFRPRTLKLFDEREFGRATFVTAKLTRDGRLLWLRTERYVSSR